MSLNKPSYKALLKLIRKEATAELQCLPEDTEIEGNVCATDEPEEDRKQEQWIHDQLGAGNPWAWCCACVEITWRGASGTLYTEREYLGCCSYESEYLGCCSYESEANFIECGERETLRDEACIALARRLHKLWTEIGAAILEAKCAIES